MAIPRQPMSFMIQSAVISTSEKWIMTLPKRVRQYWMLDYRTSLHGVSDTASNMQREPKMPVMYVSADGTFGFGEWP